MKTKLYFPSIAILFFLISLSISAQEKYTSYKGLVINQQTEEPVVSAKVEVENHDFSTVTNNEGEFTLKIPADLTNAIITTSYLGYESKSLHLRNFDQERTLIQLIESSEKLS
ncbi:MAG: carboxypeptidase-like regulatory domain-containing protein, partial [Mesonia sp.]|uniref:carboxypeptidase-like regulatory domain-containing protein n=1 Tax=Mesonia sp. TaxID=1960830 RepID=UPI003F999CD5